MIRFRRTVPQVIVVAPEPPPALTWRDFDPYAGDRIESAVRRMLDRDTPSPHPDSSWLDCEICNPRATTREDALGDERAQPATREASA